jgi:hypothetical protein
MQIAVMADPAINHNFFDDSRDEQLKQRPAAVAEAPLNYDVILEGLKKKQSLQLRAYNYLAANIDGINAKSQVLQDNLVEFGVLTERERLEKLGKQIENWEQKRLEGNPFSNEDKGRIAGATMRGDLAEVQAVFAHVFKNEQKALLGQPNRKNPELSGEELVACRKSASQAVLELMTEQKKHGLSLLIPQIRNAVISAKDPVDAKVKISDANRDLLVEYSKMLNVIGLPGEPGLPKDAVKAEMRILEGQEFFRNLSGKILTNNREEFAELLQKMQKNPEGYQRLSDKLDALAVDAALIR